MSSTFKISYFPVENVFTYTGTYQYSNWSNPTEILDKLSLDNLRSLKRSFEKVLDEMITSYHTDYPLGLLPIIINSQFVRRDQLIHQDRVKFVLTFRLEANDFTEPDIDKIEKYFTELFSSPDTPFVVCIQNSIVGEAGGCSRSLSFRFE